MDEKLARGMARDLMRKLGKTGDFFKGPLGEPILKLQNQYLGGPGVAQDKIISTGMTLQRQIASCGPFPTSYRAIRHPLRNRCVVETVRAACVEGEEQHWAVLAGAVLDIGRASCAIVETVSHVAVSQHTFVRLFQRGEFGSQRVHDLLARLSLFVTPLLKVALDRRGGLGSDVAVPYSDGLLLGTIERNPLEDGQGPSVVIVSRDGAQVDRLQAPFQLSDGSIATISINTYVGDWELFDNQKGIRSRLEMLAARNLDSMKALRTCALYGYPDPQMIERFGDKVIETIEPDAAIELMELLTAFFSTPEWKMHAEAHRRPTRALQ
jgi:hypothetical protein